MLAALLLLLLPTAQAHEACEALQRDLDAALRATALHEHPRGPCLTPALRSLSERAVSPGEASCLAEALAARDLPVGLTATVPPAPATTTSEKALRDPWGLPNLYETEHFAVRWGSYEGFNDSHVAALADAMEQSWAVQVDQMDHPAPIGTTTHKFNVYIGGTGGPASHGASGYYTYDGQGWPMVVIASNIMNDAGWRNATAAHELYHAVQDAAATYAYSGQGAFWWEATAMWIEAEVFPGTPEYASFLFSFAFVPELSVNFFQYPTSGAIEEYRQYGAGIFATYLSEFHGGWPIIRDSWVHAPVNGDPLQVISGSLAEQGTDFDQAFLDFAVRNATWDYDDGALYRAHVNAYGGWESPWSRRPTGTVREVGSGWQVPTEHLPATYGVNYWALGVPDDAFTLSFDGEAGVDWFVAVATRHGATHTRQVLEVEGGEGSLQVSGLAGADEAWLVVAPARDFHDNGWRFDYRFRLGEPLPDPPPSGDEDELPARDEGIRVAGGCGCAAPPSPAGLLPLLLVGLAGLRRYPRRSQSATSRA